MMYRTGKKFYQIKDKQIRRWLLVGFVFALQLPHLFALLGINPAEFTHSHTHIYLSEPDFDHHQTSKSHHDDGHKNQEQQESLPDVVILPENLASNQLFTLTMPQIDDLIYLNNWDDNLISKMSLIVLGVQLIYLPIAKKPPRQSEIKTIKSI
ncbi:MAG: hypothetical protein GY943_27230 [Chloroflexi bacterium]|nr:hypothetical protein [Chloroflexota bacterium]